MHVEPSPNPKPISAARLAANRANAQKSSGPRNPQNSRFNAVKHGLTARVAWAGENQQRNNEFVDATWQRLGPSNSLEKMHVGNLLQTRLREDLLLELERTVLTRLPILHTADDGQSFKFLDDPDGLAALDELVCQITCVTRTSEKQFLALIAERKECRDGRLKSTVGEPHSDISNVEVSAAQTGMTSETTCNKPPVNRGTLEDCLTESRLILPGEDADSYRSLVAGVWETLKPTNLLEGFLVGDFVQAQWRRDRAIRIQTVLLARRAVSASGHNCGFAFGFIHEVQRGNAMKTLRHYETALEKRQERRRALLRKLRREGWQDSG